MGTAAHDDAPAASPVAFANAHHAVDQRGGREVWRGNVFDQFINAQRRVFQQGKATGDHFVQVVRWDVGRHADRDAGRTVDQQVRDARRHDGEWVLFHSNQAVDGEARFEIYKVRKDGTELTNLSNTPGNNFRGDWSPDGQRIIFVSERDSNRELYVMNADGSNQVRLTDNQADDNRPRWLPDGSKILFEGNRDGDNTALYLMDAPSLVVAGPQEDKIRLLTFPGFNSQAGAWAVGGEKIVLSADRDSESIENWDVYIMDADATNFYRLTTDPELDRFPAWTP